MIRVFPRRTAMTPNDSLAFVGDPPAWIIEELRDSRVAVSCAFTWDIPEALRLVRSWSRYCDEVRFGGPAFGDPGGEFIPGRFVREGAVITSRGCFRRCSFCLVPEREGELREIEIKDGHNVLDNNLLACSREHIEQVFEMLAYQKLPAVFSGGLDSRLLRPWHIDYLKSMRLKRMFFACDSAEGLGDLVHAASLLSGFSREKKHCYVPIGFNGETPKQAEARLKAVFNLDFLPFAMLYRGLDAAGRNTPEFHDLVGTWRRPRAYKMIMEGPRSPIKGGEQLKMGTA